MARPYVICHMVTSIDGKVTGDFLQIPEIENTTQVYYQLHRDHQADAFACGRVTMEGSFTQGWYPDLSQYDEGPVPREDRVADPSARFFAVAFDRRGRLGWKSGHISDDDPGYDHAHVIEVLCEDVPDAYLCYLGHAGVSYIFAGEYELDLPLALKKLKKLFGIQKLLLEGGSILDGAFLREDVVDELSLVVAPYVAGAEGKPLFDNSILKGYALQTIKEYENSVFWLNYGQKFD